MGPGTPGKVYLVGAGPGAVDLLTVRATRLIEGAGIVFHDALVSAEILALARHADALVVDFLRGAAAQRHRGERWTCAHCGESLKGQFTDCWNCGAARPAPA